MTDQYKTSRIETLEQLILMSGSSIEIESDGDFEDAPTDDTSAVISTESDESMKADNDNEHCASDGLLARLKDMFCLSTQKRRSQSYLEANVLSEQTQPYESRQLLSATGLEGLFGVDDDHSSRFDEASEMEIDGDNVYRAVGRISDINDRDSFRLDLPESMLADIVVSFEASESGPTFDLYHHSFDAQGIPGFTISTTDPTRLLLSAGENFFSIGGNPDFVNKDYSVSITLQSYPTNEEVPPRPPGDDHSHLIEAATPLEYNPFLERYAEVGVISGRNDVDRFRLELDEPTTIELLVAHDTGGFGPAVTLSGLDDGFEQQSFAAGDTVGLNLEAGTYFVLVSGKPGMNNVEYTLTAVISDTPAENDDHAGYPSTALTEVEFNEEFGGWIFNGRFHHRRDHDSFQFEVTEPTYVVKGWGYFQALDGSYPPSVHDHRFVLLQPGLWTYSATSVDRGTGDFVPVDYEHRARAVAAEDVEEIIHGVTTSDDYPNYSTPGTIVLPYDNRIGGWLLTGQIERKYDVDAFILSVDETIDVELNGTFGEVGFQGVQPKIVDGSYRLTPGEWHVFAAGGPGFETGDYSIWLQTPGSEQVIPPDDHPDAIGPDLTHVLFDPESRQWRFEGTLEDFQDRDVFAIEVEQRSEVFFRGFRDGINAVFVGEQPATNGPLTVLTPGTWYVQVNAWRSSHGRNYVVDLAVDSTSGPPIIPPDGPDPGQLPPLIVDPAPDAFDDYPNDIGPDVPFVEFDFDRNVWVFQGRVDSLIDRDVVAIDVTEDVNVTLHGPGGSGFLGQQPELTGDLQYRLTKGIWYLQMNGGPEFESGDYTLTVEAPDSYDPPPSLRSPQPPLGSPGEPADVPDTSASVIDLGRRGTHGPTRVTVTGSSETPDDTEWYQFEISERSHLRVSTDHSGTVRLLKLSGEVVKDSVDAEFIGEVPKGTYLISMSEAAATREYELTVAVDSVFVDSVAITEGPDMSLSPRPEFHWNASDQGGDFEIFIGHRGQSEAVYRTAGIDGTSFKLPEGIGPGEYVAWVRWHGEGAMSRWGIGHDFVVSETPAVGIQGGTVTWTELDGADRYELQINEVAEDGSYVREKIVALDDLTNNEFALPADLQNQRLAAWVRAIRDTDDGPDRTAWSSVVMTHELNLDEPIDFSVLGRNSGTLELSLPVPTYTLGPSTPRKFEVYVALASDRGQFMRTELTDFEVVCDSQFTPFLPWSSGSLTLPDEFQGEDVIVWVREIGNGLKKSRWGDGLVIEPFRSSSIICAFTGPGTTGAVTQDVDSQ